MVWLRSGPINVEEMCQSDGKYIICATQIIFHERKEEEKTS
jgi:hypothetical protein